MEIGKHIGKGLWAFADKALPAIYGAGFIVFVVRVLPPAEYGIFVLIQSIFLLLLGMGQSLALQPMVKFAAETDDVSGIFSTASLYYAAFLTAASVLLIVFRVPLSSVVNAEKIASLIVYVPLLFSASYLRSVVLFLFQAKLEVQKVFWIDAVHFIGSLLCIVVLGSFRLLHTAEILLQINLLTFSCSSLIALIILFRRYAIHLRFERTLGKTFWSYGKYSFGAAVSYSIYTQADSLLISGLTGPIYVATYNAAKVFIRTFDLFLQVINLLLVPTISRLSSQNRRDDLLTLGEKSAFAFITFILPFVIGLVLFAPVIVTFFYGKKYNEAILILRLLALSGLFVPGIGIASSFAYGMSYMKEAFYVSVGATFVSVVLLATLTQGLGITGSAWAIVLSAATMCVLWYMVLVSRIGIPLRVRPVFMRHRDVINFFSKTFSSLRNS